MSLVSRSAASASVRATRSEEHTSELQSQSNLVCRLLLEKKKTCEPSWARACAQANAAGATKQAGGANSQKTGRGGARIRAASVLGAANASDSAPSARRAS